ncbi:unnamed protein product [Rhizophagus irregularis]|nr:unnamed protein product [Rhizophagus irregularis]
MRKNHIKLLLGSLRMLYNAKELVNITESVAVYSPVCETNDVVSEVRLSIDNPVPASSKSSENRKTDAFLDEFISENSPLPIIRKIHIIRKVILFIQKEAFASSINTSKFNITLSEKYIGTFNQVAKNSETSEKILSEENLPSTSQITPG